MPHEEWNLAENHGVSLEMDLVPVKPLDDCAAPLNTLIVACETLWAVMDSS